MAETKYSMSENGNNVEVKIIDYDLPFYHYTKTTKYNSNTGKVSVEKKLTKKPFEEMLSDVLIFSAGATAINLIGNGLSHFIYSLKKKKEK